MERLTAFHAQLEVTEIVRCFPDDKLESASRDPELLEVLRTADRKSQDSTR
jgi:hypothetical protein